MSSFSGIRGNLTVVRARKARSAVVEPLEGRTLLSSSSVIDVMVLYTPQAVQTAGGIPTLTQNIDRAIADTNLAMSNSQVDASLRLVHLGEVGYSDSGQLSTDLTNLQQGNGALGGVQMLRDRYGADLVSLWVGSGGGSEAGLAFQADSLNAPQPNYGYNVVEEPYANNDYVFAHEIGHNLGAGHDASDPSARAIPYAYGKLLTLGNYRIGDIMSETSADRIPYFSNPGVSFQGVPTGNPDDSAQPGDNARAMNEFAPIVANYEPTVMGIASPPTAALLSASVNQATQTLTVQVEYQASSAVSVSALGTGDVLITGPSGFHQFGTLQSVDFPSDGPQRVAGYQVNVSGYSTDPAAYNIALEPNRVRDTSGNVAASAVLSAPDGTFPNRAGPRLCTAFNAGTLDGQSWSFSNAIDSADPTAFYRFTLSGTEQCTAHLSGLTGNVGELLVQDQNLDGQIQGTEILADPYQPGGTPESISTSLAPGTYYLWVAPPALGTNSAYHLTISATSATPPISPSPKPPPAFAISGNSTVNEQSPYTLGLSALDPDHVITNWTINWGDGDTQAIAGNPASAVHTYGIGPNSYTISATATDDTGISYVAAHTQAVQVLHGPPAPVLSGPASINAGSVYALNLTAADAGHPIVGWAINWGDGSAVQNVTGAPSSVTHVYSSGGQSDNITATMTDDVGTYAAATAVAVNVLPPAIALNGASATAVGAGYSVGLVAVEPGGQTVGQWVVNWGDGAAPQAIAGSVTSASHVYAATGTFSVSAVATDQQGTRSTNVISLTVAPPLETLQAASLGALPARGSRAAAASFAGPSATRLYRFTLSQPQIITLRLTSQRPSILMELLDQNLSTLSTRSGNSGGTIRLTLGPGTYYVRCSFTVRRYNAKRPRPNHYRFAALTRPVPKPRKPRPTRHAARRAVPRSPHLQK